MNDRELLEFAAKASGYSSKGYAELVGGDPALLLRESDFTGMWAPLTDDGDALRLSVKLGIQIIPGQGYVEAVKIHRGLREMRFLEGHQDDAEKATRRAITRCAAALGELK